MSEKRRCPNCGAYLTNQDKVCYVCGEIVPTDVDEHTEPVTEEEPTQEAPRTMVEKFEENDKYSNPDDYEEDKPSDGYDEDYEPQKKRGSKKTAIICAILVGVVAVVAATLCVCSFSGIFGGSDDQKEFTLYFDKPSLYLNLLDENGTAYNWGADVELSYVDKNGEEQTVVCNPLPEYDTLWKGVVPSDAQQVYFYQSGEIKLRTQVLPDIEDERVFYVTDILLNSELELPVSSCTFSEFDNLGVNATEETAPQIVEETTEETTESETEPDSTEAETTPPATESTTYADSGQDKYTISVPSSWQEKATVIEKGNCTTYYETYNYNNYQNGMLLSIYVYDENDNSYGDMKVEKVLKTSDGHKIVMVTPSDVEFNDADETAAENYISLSALTTQVINSVTAK